MYNTVKFLLGQGRIFRDIHPCLSEMNSFYGCVAIVSSGNKILTSITTLDNADDHNLNYLNI